MIAQHDGCIFSGSGSVRAPDAVVAQRCRGGRGHGRGESAQRELLLGCRPPDMPVMCR